MMNRRYLYIIIIIHTHIYIYNIYLRYTAKCPAALWFSTPTPTTQWRSAFRILIQLNLSDGVRNKEYDDDDDDVSATATAARKRPNYTRIYTCILLYNMFHSSGPV